MNKALYVEFEYQATLWIFEPFTSARRTSYPVPPPTTLVGALSYGVARVLHAKGKSALGELEKSSSKSIKPSVFAKVASVVDQVFYAQLDGYAVITEDITRFFQGPYIRAENVKDPQQRWGVKVSSKIYLPKVRAATIYVLRDLDELGLDEDTLIRGAYSIKRIGPIEGLVSVEYAELLDVEDREFDEELTERFINQGTYFYFDAGQFAIDPVNWVLIPMPSHKRLSEWLRGDAYGACTQILIPVDRNLLKMRIVTPFTWSFEIVERFVRVNTKVFSDLRAYVVRIRGTEVVLPYAR